MDAEKRHIMNFARQSSRVSCDKVAMKNIKNYLLMRDKFKNNSPGKIVNGRELKAPSSLPRSKLKNKGSTQ